jgi:cystathionine beta-lyase
MIQGGFELPLDVLRARRNAKWVRYGADILPAWVAEMDFAVAYPIRRAMDRITAEQEYGYPMRNGGGADKALAESFVRRMTARFGWTPDAALVEPLTDLVQGQFATIWAYSEPGDGVILQLPAYPPFHMAIKETGRQLLANRMRDSGSRYEIDFADMEALAKRSRILMLCNPQNPTGRAFTRAELERIGRIAIEHDLIVVSDEIHCDLIYDDHVHIPLATISPEVAARTVTITSATKGFNIPGLRCAVMHFGSQELKDRFRARFPAHMLGQPGIVGIDATIAAWDEGQPWLDGVLKVLQSNRDRMADVIAAEMPGVVFRKPEATYLGWLDCANLALPTNAHDFFHDRAKVGLSPGQMFDPNCEKYARFNFATSPAILEEILERMVGALRSHNG